MVPAMSDPRDAGSRPDVGPIPGITVGEDGVPRCWWAGTDSEYRRYHDDEWGRPVDDDGRLFEKLCLEGFQAGLSWLTILRKRENFRHAFANFDPGAVARFSDRDAGRLMGDTGIVRNRAKIEATINNARRCGELIDEFGSLASYVWSFEPVLDSPQAPDQAGLMELTKSIESVAMSKDLKRRGWSFVGPTTVYAFMQAVGLVNDHLEGCAARVEVERQRQAFTRPPPRLIAPGRPLSTAPRDAP
jgi:DNA-3-methyladenine glycosylase I